MKKSKVRTFLSRLKEDMKDPEFKAHYKEERQALMLAMKIAKLREKKSLSQLQLAKLMGTYDFLCKKRTYDMYIRPKRA